MHCIASLWSLTRIFVHAEVSSRDHRVHAGVRGTVMTRRSRCTNVCHYHSHAQTLNTLNAMYLLRRAIFIVDCIER